MARTAIQLDEDLKKKIEEKFELFVEKATKIGAVGKVKNIRLMKPIDKYTYLTELVFRNPVFIDKNMLALISYVERQCIHYGYTTNALAEATAEAMKVY